MTFPRFASIASTFAMQVAFVAIYIWLRNQALPVIPEGMQWITAGGADIASIIVAYAGMWFIKDKMIAVGFQLAAGIAPAYITSAAMLSWVGIELNVFFSWLVIFVAMGSIIWTGINVSYNEALKMKLEMFERLYAKL